MLFPVQFAVACAPGMYLLARDSTCMSPFLHIARHIVASPPLARTHTHTRAYRIPTRSCAHHTRSSTHTRTHAHARTRPHTRARAHTHTHTHTHGYPHSPHATASVAHCMRRTPGDGPQRTRAAKPSRGHAPQPGHRPAQPPVAAHPDRPRPQGAGLLPSDCSARRRQCTRAGTAGHTGRRPESSCARVARSVFTTIFAGKDGRKYLVCDGSLSSGLFPTCRGLFLGSLS